MSQSRTYDVYIMGPDAFFAKQLPRAAQRMLQMLASRSGGDLRNMAEQYPQAMFLPASLRGVDDKDFQFSPLTFAIYTYDIYALEIFRKIAATSGLTKHFLGVADELENRRKTAQIIAAYSRVANVYAQPDPEGFYGPRLGMSFAHRQEHWLEMLNNMKMVQPTKVTQQEVKPECVLM